MTQNLKEKIYYVKGMHCASCEILLEKELLKFENIKFVDASTSEGAVRIGYLNKEPDVKELNNFFKKYGYTFFEKPFDLKEEDKTDWKFVFALVILVFSVIFFLKNLGVDSFSVNSASSLLAFFLLGVVASISSCGALVGGLMLSMSRQWNEIYLRKDSTFYKLQPYLLFNIGRIISYAILGGVVGFIGGRIQLSLGFSSFLTILVSVLMMVLGLQMLNVKYFRNFKITLPKFFTRFIADERKFKGKYMPFLMGALTFFLPCGFTLTAQSLALLSGDFLKASLIMLSFALGTTPGLLAIGFSSVKFLDKKHLANSFSKAAGILVLFLALYNLNSQLNVLGLPNISEFKNFLSNKEVVNQSDLAPIIDGKQVIKMRALAYGYEPNYFKVRAGIPVRWEIENISASGCTNEIIARDLFEGSIPLEIGKISVKEFIPPEKPGKYRFSCWMGMASGIIEVVSN
jgi:sulfite exporter TauE/SafE/copper chaperone CopZ